jgi:hypothetical protein
MGDLHQYVADNPGSDPLEGNYTLVYLQDLVLNFQGLSDKYEMVALTVEPTGTPPTQQPALAERGQLIQGDQIGGKHLAMTTGMLRGGGEAAIASVYDDGGQLMLHIATNDPDGALQVVATAPVAPVIGACTVRTMAGRLLDRAVDSFVVAWADETGVLYIQMWETDDQLVPTASFAHAAITIGGNAFDLAIADLDQDGLDEVVVAWPESSDTGGPAMLNLSLVTLAGDLATSGPQVAQPVHVGLLGAAGSFAVTSGSFDTTPVSDQLAVAWGDVNGNANLVLYSPDDRGALTRCGTPYADTAYPLSGSMLIRLATGDFDLDGFDEIVMGTVGDRLGQDEVVILHVLAADDTLQLTLQSVGAVGRPDVAFAHIDLALAYGNLGASGMPGIVVAALGAAGLQPVVGISQLNVGIVQLSGNGLLPPQLTEGVGTLTGALTFEAQDPDLDLTLSIALGDFTGNSIRVGPPTHFTFDQVNSILAIVNGPPAETGVNAGLKASLNFSDGSTTQSSFNYMINDGWTASDELGANLSTGIGQLTQSMTTTYGTNFANNSGSSKAYTQVMNDRLTTDDMVLLSGTAYDVWEYPVYAASSGESPGCILVAFPDVAGPETIAQFGNTPSTDYAPDHAPGVLLSYASEPPADWTPAGAISQPYLFQVDDASVGVIYNSLNNNIEAQSLVQASTTNITDGFNLSKSFNFFGGIGIGLQARFANTYTNSSMSNYSITYTNTTSIALTYDPLPDPSQAYQVSPYIYFSDEGGFLVVDYVVDVPDDGYWQQTYGQPAPQFNKLWESSTDPSLHDLTRSICFVDNPDGSLTITARVANYSLVDAHGVQVYFYLGCPSSPGSRLLGVPAPIAVVAAQQRQNVSVNWHPSQPKPGPVPPPPYTVYATIEPVQDGAFYSSKAYAVYTGTGQ